MAESERNENQEIQISPIEDLMREHGVLHRILLIYRDIISRLTGEKPYDPFLIHPAVFSAADIAQKFIENYHQVLEEQYIFPRFIENRQDEDLVRTLLQQHNAARCLTTNILRLTASQYVSHPSYRFQLIQLLTSYVRMYEPHSSREDTVLFPAFHALVNEETFKALGEKFEETEEQKFGENGFQSIVRQVAQIEQTLGIYDLNQFTPYCVSY